MTALSIGALARRTDVKVPTIRYYESAGLLPQPDRTASNRRVYDADAIDRLAFIRHARDLGFGMDAIRALLDLRGQPEQPCARPSRASRSKPSTARCGNWRPSSATCNGWSSAATDIQWRNAA